MKNPPKHHIRCATLIALLTSFAFAATADPTPTPTPKKATAEQAEARSQAETFIRTHTERLQREDIDGYLADFIKDHGALPVLRSHLVRAFRDYDLSAEIESIHFEKLLTQTAHIKVTQHTLRSETSSGLKISERAEIQYFLRRPNASAPWRIEHTERTRLDDSPPPP